MFKRPQYQTLKKRMKEPRKFIQVIIGPRQVGKTTLIKQYLEDTSLPFHFVSADNIPAKNTSWIDQQWDTARLKKEALKNSKRDSILTNSCLSEDQDYPGRIFY